MTGYMTINVPYIRSREGDMIDATTIDQIAYIILDGERIGKSDNYSVPFRLKGIIPSRYLPLFWFPR